VRALLRPLGCVSLYVSLGGAACTDAPRTDNRGDQSVNALEGEAFTIR
jgi:hypothetical protein